MKRDFVFTLGRSPDSDDAFMYYPLASGKISTGRIRYREVVKDIESLNRMALAGSIDITAFSVHAYAKANSRYRLLDIGGSFGDGYGPLVVSPRPLKRTELEGKRIALPGRYTSAALAAHLLLPPFKPVWARFDETAELVKKGVCEAGVLIHEAQLSYQKEGLYPVADLGALWKEKTGLPLPLGANGISKNIPEEVCRTVASHLKEALRFSLEHFEEALDYSLPFARGLPKAQVKRFVKMYVNQRSLSYGEEEIASLKRFFREGMKKGLLPEIAEIEIAGINGTEKHPVF